MVEAVRGDIRAISYNLREHRAKGEVQALAENHTIDMLCLQECDSTDMPSAIGGLRLAAQTDRNRLGLAVYYRESRFTLIETEIFALRKSMHDRVLAPAHERLLAARLADTTGGGEIVVGDFHAAPLSATNALRRHQISSALELMRGLSSTAPLLMVGDYNYPWFQRGLKRQMALSGYDFSRSDSPTYRTKRFRGHFDFAMSVDLRIERVETLPQGLSDHLPIMITAAYGAER
jgi:endonuclease/exonuclease/phosphatase family metal-dependent hydrolase